MTAVDTITPTMPPTELSANGTATASALPSRELETMSTISSLNDLDARCGGCRKVIDQDNGGIVVAFGSSLWHVDCFRCAKCQEKVSADTNLLLLSDGSPVCGNCSYQCFVCKQAITEEAIMTGDESYHAQCFTCRTCKRRIEELVFAKTTQGIYCMSCHNDRVARSRRHAEAKRQRAARKEREARERADAELAAASAGANGVGSGGHAVAVDNSNQRMPGSSTSTSLNVLANTVSREPVPTTTSASPATMSPGDRKGTSSAVASPRGELSKSPAAGVSPQSVAAQRTLSADRAAPGSAARSPVARSPSPVPSRQTTGGDRSMPSSPALDAPLMSRGQSQDLPPRSTSASPAPASLSPTSPIASLGQSIQHSPTTPNLAADTARQNAGLGVGLGVPTSKASKRRSINPGMTFNMDVHNGTFAAEPRASSPLRATTDPEQTPRSPLPASGADKERAATSPALTTTPAVTASTSPVLDDGSAVTVPGGKGAEEKENKDPKGASEGGKTGGDVDGSTSSHGHDQLLGKDGEPKPRIDAPALPTMSFSLSDPDFAVLLKEMESSPKKQGSAVPDVPVVRTDAGSTHSSPNLHAPSDSENDGSGMPISRSPNINLTEAANGDDNSLLTPSGLPNSSTRRRRLSMESAVSVRLGAETALASLKEQVAEAKGDKVTVDRDLLNEVIREADALREAALTLKNKYTGAKRSSQQYSEGLTIAGEEYDKEVAMRQELETEVSRLRAQVHGQTARLSVISSEERRAENLRRRSHDLASNLTGLERDISRLRAQRDISLAEVEELHAKKGDVGGNAEETTSKLGRSLTRRLETIKEQYRDELAPLSAQREALQRELNELRDTREQFLEESTALAAKNEELGEVNAQLRSQVENMQDALTRRGPSPFPHTTVKPPRGHPSGSPSMSSLANALQDVPEETARVVKVTKPVEVEAAPVRRFKWIGGGKSPKAELPKPAAVEAVKSSGGRYRPSTEMGTRDHQFQQHSTMRLGRCELCQDKMWGLQEVKCASCGIVCHSKCAEKLPKACPGKPDADDGPLPPSMFGRDLSEQAEWDGAGVPMIVTKCIRAVEANGMEYEGIYRKTGGSSQSKQITQLFERAKYDTFDLTNVEAFNDISSITSVLKTYFRQLPDPLMTHALHESFVAAANIRDHANKHAALCALLKELPNPHFNTLKVLMLHLNRVTAKSSVNLMTSQNLGVVFGPTLLRSKDPGREFGDMAGKALSVQWMVENAPTVFVEEDKA